MCVCMEYLYKQLLFAFKPHQITSEGVIAIGEYV